MPPWCVLSMAFVFLVPLVGAEERVIGEKATAAKERAPGKLDPVVMEIINLFTMDLAPRSPSGGASEKSNFEAFRNLFTTIYHKYEGALGEMEGSESNAHEKPSETNLFKGLINKLSKVFTAGGHTMRDRKFSRENTDEEILSTPSQNGFRTGGDEVSQGTTADGVGRLAEKLSRMIHEYEKEELPKLSQGKTDHGVEKLMLKLPFTLVRSNVEKLADPDHGLGSSYLKVSAVTKDWLDPCFRTTVVPLVYKAILFGYIFLKTEKTKIISKLGRPIDSFVDNSDMFGQCGNLHKAGLPFCLLTKSVLHGVGVAATTAGHLSEAYVRTMLSSDSKLKHYNTDMFDRTLMSLCWNLPMLQIVLLRSVDFKNAVWSRYFTKPLPASDTESDFVKVSDDLYGAMSDLLDMSRHTLGSIYYALRDGKSMHGAVLPLLIDNYEYAVKRGIPKEYSSSLYPPLSYYWDMMALQNAVTLLSDIKDLPDIEDLAKGKLQEPLEGTADPSLDGKCICRACTAAKQLLTSINEKVVRNELQEALLFVTNGLHSVMAAIGDAGMEVMNKECDFKEACQMLTDKMKPLSEEWVEEWREFLTLHNSPFPGLLSVLKMAMKPALEIYSSLVPVTYENLIEKVQQVSMMVSGNARKANGNARKAKSLCLRNRENYSLTDEVIWSRICNPDRFSDSLGELSVGVVLLLDQSVNDEKFMSIANDFSDDSEFSSYKDTDECLLSSDCQRPVFRRFLEAVLIRHDQELNEQWESTRSNPLEGKDLEQVLSDAGLQLGPLLHEDYPFSVLEQEVTDA